MFGVKKHSVMVIDKPRWFVLSEPFDVGETITIKATDLVSYKDPAGIVGHKPSVKIDGLSFLEIKRTYGSFTLCWSGEEWLIL